MKRHLIEKYILNEDGRLTEYGLMLLARMDEDAIVGLYMEMEKEMENRIAGTLERCGFRYDKYSMDAEELRQMIIVRIVTKYSEKFIFERYEYPDNFYVEGWRNLPKNELLDEYIKYLKLKHWD